VIEKIKMNPYLVEQEKYLSERSRHWNILGEKNKSSLGSYYRSKISGIYAHLIPANSRILELGVGDGTLLASLQPSLGVGVDFSKAQLSRGAAQNPQIIFIEGNANSFKLLEDKFDYIIISDLVNDAWDVQEILSHVNKLCDPSTRIIINFYNHFWNIPLFVARKLGFASPMMNQNWLTRQDMENLLEISSFQCMSVWGEIIFPLNIPIISNFINRYFAKLPFINKLCLANFIVSRPIMGRGEGLPSVSIIVPARNEEGNISEIVERVPKLGSQTEIIFVEGNSTDNTYEAIEKIISLGKQSNLKLIKQLGKGKGDAVRAGFDIAHGDILMILDADITVPPEDLPKFYALLASNKAEFVNGVRLVYPVEDKAMQFFNLIGNKFFSIAFSWLLNQPIRDTLCGTKVLWRHDYQRIAANRKIFGDFDPFGDFDLLFGAARLNLKILEVPIRYRARRYGETNISRWRHGWLLLKMVAFAARRIKFI